MLKPTNRFDQDQGRDIILPKPARWLHPDSIALAYYKELNARVNLLIDLVRKNLIPALPAIISESKVFNPDSIDNIIEFPTFKLDRNKTREEIYYGSLISLEVRRDTKTPDLTSSENDNNRRAVRDFYKNDQYADDISTIINNIELQYAEIYTPEVNATTATQTGVATNQYNERQFQKVMKSVLGVDVFITEPWLQDTLKAFVKDNVALIKSLSQDYFSQIETLTFRGVRAGQRHEDIAKEMQKRFEATRNRAKLIARDQVGKLNGQLTELRQRSAGITEYYWRSAGDNRVRPQHKKYNEQSNNGKTFKWSSPPEGGNPGEAIQCRCYAEPIISSATYERFTGIRATGTIR